MAPQIRTVKGAAARPPAPPDAAAGSHSSTGEPVDDAGVPFPDEELGAFGDSDDWPGPFGAARLGIP